jgi:hypothetical protein
MYCENIANLLCSKVMPVFDTTQTLYVYNDNFITYSGLERVGSEAYSKAVFLCVMFMV